MTFLLLSLSIGALTAGLVAGYVLAYAHSVMPGLSRADDRVFIASAQRIIASVGTPFFIVLSNIPLIAFLAGVIAAFVVRPGPAVTVLVIAALLLYVATLLLTFRGNVPLNQVLLGIGDDADPVKLASTRAAFEQPWKRINTLRTITAIAAAAASNSALTLAHPLIS